ncbi:MAG: VWA domain-containing protein, partial [Myxococcales bacterium]|nr:VWA domain-containing protein [Myxococcales bacterium]
MALPQLFACLDHPLKEVEYDKSQEGKKGISIAVNKDVDIIFVIDDSGSMAEEQALLSANFEAFINVLEADDVQANYRLAITTTDAGNPRCPKADTTPLNGNFELSSCVDRVGLGHFTFAGVDPPLDASYSCTDFCDLTDADLQIRPTTTEKDATEKARPWLQNLEGETNLPDGVTTVQAFQCFGPQGVAGCGFESHLESMYKALTRAETDGEDNYGFLREQAILSVVFVTDEADCSYNEDHKAVFIDQKALWNDPNDPIPTSAVCWRAGVECDGSTCSSENIDIAGNKGASDADAVLHPVSRYIDRLQSIEDEKRKLDSGAEVLVAVIGGVPPGYDGDVADIPYSQSGDQAFLDDFGTDPGCVSAPNMDGEVGRAVPPVRLREFAEKFQVGEDTNLFSIC